MSDPKRINEDSALALAIFELARVTALVTSNKRDDAAPAPEMVAA